jgi:hypothetical protein
MSAGEVAVNRRWVILVLLIVTVAGCRPRTTWPGANKVVSAADEQRVHDAVAELASPAYADRRTGTPLQFKAIGLQEPPGYKDYLATYDVPLYVVTSFTGIKASLVYAETDIKYLVPSAQHSGFRPRERSQVGWPLHHFFLEVDGSAVDHEGAVPVVMDHPAFLALRISPGLDYFQDEEVVLVDQAVV